jgi:hypothetical protein
MLSIRTGAMLDLVAELVQSQTVGDWFYQPWPAELSQNETGMSSQYHHRSFSVRYVSSRFDLQDQGSVVRRLRGDPQPYTTASLEVFWFAYLQMDDAHEAYVSTLNLQDEIIAALQVAPTGGPVRLAVETAECELGDNFDARGRVRVIATYHTTLPS